MHKVYTSLLIYILRFIGLFNRCPTECRLANSTSPWQCIVSLRFVVDSTGQPLGQARNQQFGDVIRDKSKVEDRIRRAQLAILNPTKLLKFFLENEGEYNDDSQLSFSQNCVTLQISGPDVADLSFCDLPGTMFKAPLFVYLISNNIHRTYCQSEQQPRRQRRYRPR